MRLSTKRAWTWWNCQHLRYFSRFYQDTGRHPNRHRTNKSKRAPKISYRRRPRTYRSCKWELGMEQRKTRHRNKSKSLQKQKLLILIITTRLIKLQDMLTSFSRKLFSGLMTSLSILIESSSFARHILGSSFQETSSQSLMSSKIRISKFKPKKEYFLNCMKLSMLRTISHLNGYSSH